MCSRSFTGSRVDESWQLRITPLLASSTSSSSSSRLLRQQHNDGERAGEQREASLVSEQERPTGCRSHVVHQRLRDKVVVRLRQGE
ncbi:hypothetical protein OPV22_015251 [Ensete ventricosum]|uniref:Uncharacterized protein n=1 Tax=Ensete ventricosum TaxID=4639 RepID=A0AAV8R3F0_ENSVE|nr:hypothetical protein OPV22_015251 [Ensete ventricosum]